MRPMRNTAMDERRTDALEAVRHLCTRAPDAPGLPESGDPRDELKTPEPGDDDLQ
jgi:hypothetical protein